MSYGRNFSSSQQLSRDNQDSSNSTNGAPSEQGSFRSSSFGGGWGRPPSDSRSQASSGGGGWGRPHYAPATGSGGWGRSSFQRFPAAASGGWGRRPASEEASTQPLQQPQEPQEPQLEQETSEQTAPPEGYDYEFIMFSFNKKFNMPKDLSQDDLPVLNNLVMDYIHRNPLRYGQKLNDAVDRALLKIHEDLQSKLRRTIPQKLNEDSKELTEVEKFFKDVENTLISSNVAVPAAQVKDFLSKYIGMKPSDLVFPFKDPTTRIWQVLSSSSLYGQLHALHAFYAFSRSVDIFAILQRQLPQMHDGQVPLSLFSPNDRKLIIDATNREGTGLVQNAFLIMFLPKELRFKLIDDLEDSLLGLIAQSTLRIIDLKDGQRKPGDICIYMPDKILTQSAKDKDSAITMQQGKHGRPHSQYSEKRRNPGMTEADADNWKRAGIPCSYASANMMIPMERFCKIMEEWGGKPLRVFNDTVKESIPEAQEESDELCALQSSFSTFGLPGTQISSSSSLWGAAAEAAP